MLGFKRQSRVRAPKSQVESGLPRSPFKATEPRTKGPVFLKRLVEPRDRGGVPLKGPGL